MNRRAFIGLGLLAATALTPVAVALRPVRPSDPGASASAGEMPIVRSTAIGDGFDADGMAALPLRKEAQRIFADSEQGDDRYNGLSPYPGFRANGKGAAAQNEASGQGKADAAYGPKRTVAGAIAAIRDGVGDHGLFCGTFADSCGSDLVGKKGFSAKYPTCLRSYDRAQPWNATTYGRGLAKLATGYTKTFLVFSYNANPDSDFFAFQGIDFSPADQNNPGLLLLSSRHWLFENCRFRQLNVSMASPEDHPDSRILNNIVYRWCSFYGGTDNGLYGGTMLGLVVEDCVFWRNGIPLGKTRDTAPATVFSHGLYLSTGCHDAIVRRCVVSDPSATGIMLRGGGQVHHNIVLKAPIAIIMGAGDQYGRAYPGEPPRNLFYLKANPAPGESFTLNGTKFVAGTDFTIGATPAATMDAFAAALAASASPVVARVRQGKAYRFNSTGGLPVTAPGPGFKRNNFQGFEAVFLDYDSAANDGADIAGAASGPNTVAHFIYPDLNPATDHGNHATGYKPDGVNCDVHHNLILGDADITSADGMARGTGIFICNTKPGSRVHHNVIARSRRMTGTNVYALDVQSGMPQPTVVQFDRNVIYQWSAQSDVPQLFSATQNRDTYTRNIWDKPASGSNRNIASVAFPNPVTRAQVNALLGFASDDAMMAALVEAPRDGWAKKVLDAALPGYGLTYADD